MEALLLELKFNVRIEVCNAPGRQLRFCSAHIALAVENLTLQVGKVEFIAVNAAKVLQLRQRPGKATQANRCRLRPQRAQWNPSASPGRRGALQEGVCFSNSG